MVIGKSANLRSLKIVTDMPFVYKGNKSAWMTFALFEEWFAHRTFVPEVGSFLTKPKNLVLLKNCLNKQVKEFLRAQNHPKEELLLIDNALCHPKEGELKSYNGQISVMCLPPNCTALIQPMNQNIIRQYQHSAYAFIGWFITTILKSHAQKTTQ